MTRKTAILVAALFALAMLVAVGIGNRILSVQTATAQTAPDPCATRCIDQARACTRAEDARHRAAKAACGADKACVQAEQALHQANIASCREEEKRCKATCL